MSKMSDPIYLIHLYSRDNEITIQNLHIDPNYILPTTQDSVFNIQHLNLRLQNDNPLEQYLKCQQNLVKIKSKLEGRAQLAILKYKIDYHSEQNFPQQMKDELDAVNTSTKY